MYPLNFYHQMSSLSSFPQLTQPRFSALARSDDSVVRAARGASDNGKVVASSYAAVLERYLDEFITAHRGDAFHQGLDIKLQPIVLYASGRIGAKSKVWESVLILLNGEAHPDRDMMKHHGRRYRDPLAHLLDRLYQLTSLQNKSPLTFSE